MAARNLVLGESTRYSYSDDGLVLVAGERGDVIDYGATPVVSPITADLGSASKFSGLVVNDSVTGSETDRYSFSLRESELRSTATGLVLLGVEVLGVDRLARIEGLTPVVSRTDLDGTFALFAIEREGLNLLSVSGSGNYSLRLSVAGDLNGDGSVDGVDSQLLMGAISTRSYSELFDLNRDRVLDATDVQILGSNYGFSANRAPSVTGTSVLTHEDLGVTIGLDKLAVDPEGDEIFWKAINPVNGTVVFESDGLTARFKPNTGYTGMASFELVADDGFGASVPATITVKVSDAPLIALDFVKRNPKLQVNEQFKFEVIGDFADQEDVLLSGDYLTWRSENSSVANISQTGLLTGLKDGTTILSAERDGISLATAAKVGKTTAPTNSAEFYANIAEKSGLDIFPEAVTIAPGVTIPIDVSVGQDFTQGPDLSVFESGTRYFVSNPEIAVVSPNGMLMGLQEGIVDVTVIHGAAEFVIPVKTVNTHTLPILVTARFM